MMDKILIATDFSEEAFLAARAGVAMARGLGASVTLLHVYHPWGDYFDPPGFRERMRPTLLTKLEEWVPSLDAEGVEVKTALEEGRPSTAIVAFARRWNHELVLLGSQGAGRAPRIGPGSTAERVVRTATVPVLVVPSTWTAAPAQRSDAGAPRHALGRRILVAHDFSATSTRGLSLVREMRSRLHCAVDVFHVFLDPFAEAERVPEESEWASSEKLDAHADAMHRKLRTTVDETFGPDAQAVGVHVERSGKPGHAIVQKASELGADLVCIGTTGKSGVERMLLGSTSLHVVRHSSVPVLAVH